MSIYTYEEFIMRANDSLDDDPKLMRTFCSAEFPAYFRRRIEELATQMEKKYRYLLTFTVREVPDDEDEIENYIILQMKRPPLKIYNAYIVKEYGGQNGRVHWHVAVESLRALKKDRFHYYQKKYGLLEVNRTKAQNLHETLNYISKDDIPRRIVADGV